MTADSLTFPTQTRLFDGLDDQPLDAMLLLLRQLRDDPRTGKIDLGIGVYGDEAGRTPVMQAVRQAERIVAEAQTTKAYVAAEGDARFIALLASIVLGAARAADDRYCGLQTPGGTGALRLAAELIARANPDARVWVGTPTWINHQALMRSAGLQVLEHPFFDQSTQTVLFDAMISTLETARPGDVLLLHACCHNPTGAGFTSDQWRTIADLCARKGLLPLIDIAYQGLGHGLEEDAAAMRALLDIVPEALITASCSKNFGLYRERLGALWIKGSNAQAALRARANCVKAGRSMWSMPPDHGASVVRTILESADLTANWQAELATMRARINSVRTELARAVPQLASVAQQTGMFVLLPLSREAVAELRVKHGVYMVENGRMNVAGLRSENLPRFAAALEPYLSKGE
ncbi:aromatic amino acid transaminase [Asticcacaulis sp.]|uniref:amino acid aminotransferase n=1 Tax=Asticcacaulis sp. TaxID=1872648 RepID=UPI002C780374|nr:aromatic amino acid transaminase [Asticcacaulis sp.]HTM79898.1 aromatic amino acid transaminase [Asticcacaulis sp.]